MPQGATQGGQGSVQGREQAWQDLENMPSLGAFCGMLRSQSGQFKLKGAVGFGNLNVFWAVL